MEAIICVRQPYTVMPAYTGTHVHIAFCELYICEESWPLKIAVKFHWVERQNQKFRHHLSHSNFQKWYFLDPALEARIKPGKENLFSLLFSSHLSANASQYLMH